MATTSEKLDLIAELAAEAGWTDQTEAEEQLEAAARSFNRGKLTDALQDYVDARRAEYGLAPAADCRRRVTFAHPIHGDHIYVHAQTLDGKIESASFTEFGRKTTTLTGIIRLLRSEVMTAKYRKVTA